MVYSVYKERPTTVVVPRWIALVFSGHASIHLYFRSYTGSLEPPQRALFVLRLAKALCQTTETFGLGFATSSYTNT